MSGFSFWLLPSYITHLIAAMPVLFDTTRLVEFADTDMAGITHFASFYRYMESAEHELLRSLGLSVYSEIDGVPITFPRVAASCEFHSPARCEDVLDIDVTIAESARRASPMASRFRTRAARWPRAK